MWIQYVAGQISGHIQRIYNKFGIALQSKVQELDSAPFLGRMITRIKKWVGDLGG